MYTKFLLCYRNCARLTKMSNLSPLGNSLSIGGYLSFSVRVGYIPDEAEKHDRGTLNSTFGTGWLLGVEVGPERPVEVSKE